MPKKISFFNAGHPFVLRNKTLYRSWIESVVVKEKRRIGSLSYVFCSDAYLLDLNIKHLSHRTLTDIITFDLSEDRKVVEGEIYISIERVKENAAIYNSGFSNELSRVMIHGILHLCGYKDKTDAEKKRMRAKENKYLSLLERQS